MTTGELITISGILIGIIAGALTTYIDMKIRVATLLERVKNLEKNHDGFNITVNKIFDELKEISNRLAGKEDRK